VLIIHASVRGLHVLDNFLYLFFFNLAFKLRGAKYSCILEKTKASSRPSHYFYIIKKTYILLISRPYSPHFLHRATRSWLKYTKAYKNIDDIPLKHGQYWSCVEFIYQHQSSHLTTVSFSVRNLLANGTLRQNWPSWCSNFWDQVTLIGKADPPSIQIEELLSNPKRIRVKLIYIPWETRGKAVTTRCKSYNSCFSISKNIS